jgi:sulfite oxidase
MGNGTSLLRKVFKMNKIYEMRRRTFLVGSTATLAATAFAASGASVKAQDAKPLPGYVDWKNKDAMIVHSDNTVETKRAYTGSIITPEENLYIRNNVTPPDASIVADRDAWKVEITGVKTPKTLTVGELKAMGLATVAMVLQCSGNGRQFMKEKVEGTEHKISGTSWSVGAAGNVIWTGVPLKTVVEALGGPVDGAKFITSTGGEVIPPELKAEDVIVERSVPVETLETAMLAWDLNGKPISLAHGGPLRIIIPGYTGVNNVKYVKTVAFTEKESEAKIQQTRYRLYPIGGKASPSDPSVWEMSVKSWVTSPLADGKAGPVTVSGIAFGGVDAVRGVEVSLDGGKSWEKAELVGPDLGRYAWRQFALSKELKAGSYEIVSRATDEKGNVQPEDVELNGSGYVHNGWRAHGVKLALS